MSEQCANCGQEITSTFVLDVDSTVVGGWFWRSPDGTDGCDWGEVDHPCSGTYRWMDYHQPIDTAGLTP